MLTGGFGDGGWGHKPRHTERFIEKIRKQILPLEKENNPADPF